MHIRVTIEPADVLAAKKPDAQVLSQILSALYGKMGDNGWHSVTVEQIPEDYESLINEYTALIPEGYDGDEAPEAIILKYLQDIDRLGGILARLTSAYR
ncbi:MAG TPA: hypothetical protein VNS88_17545 [Nitrospiraceae bacterium]|nr:hypothetical protein [Nitrospiraceae bacterium]